MTASGSFVIIVIVVVAVIIFFVFRPVRDTGAVIDAVLARGVGSHCRQERLPRAGDAGQGSQRQDENGANR